MLAGPRWRHTLQLNFAETPIIVANRKRPPQLAASSLDQLQNFRMLFEHLLKVGKGIDTLSCFACQEAQSSNMRHLKINGLREPATEKWAKFQRY